MRWARLLISPGRKRPGNRASYIVNRYINYSNYCILSCQFCSFSRKKRDADGFELTVPQIVEKAREALKIGITELHIVGGLHPSLPFSYYTDMLKALKALDPRLQLKCFTAIEILHLAWLAKKSVEQTLVELKAAGLDALTGGGAEIFRRKSAPPSPGARNPPRNIWMSTAPGTAWAAQHLHHALRPCGNAGRPRGSPAPVARIAGRNPRLHRAHPARLPAGKQRHSRRAAHRPYDSLRTIAISRIYLDNFDHITAYWVGLGLKLAQVALSYGADDIHGTIIEEHIFHMAGATSPQLQTEADDDQGHPRGGPHARPTQHLLRTDQSF
jgi:aminodeoxyfutalosine synthase